MSPRVRISVLAAALVAATVLVAGGAADGVNPTISISYRPNCGFSVLISGLTADSNGPPGITVPPGPYDVVISTTLPDAPFDAPPSGCSAIQFSLTGPGVSWSTNLDNGIAYGDRTTVTLLPSSVYTAVDGNHPGSTTRVFSTAATGSSASLLLPGQPSYIGTTSGQTESGIVGSALAPFRGSLQAAVTATGAESLLAGGVGVSTLQAGSYSIVATDASATAGLALRKGSHQAVTLTTAPFQGKKTVKLTLTAGTWTLLSKGGRSVQFVVG